MTDERLERIESILQAIVVLTQQNREDIAQLTREVRTIAASLELQGVTEGLQAR